MSKSILALILLYSLTLTAKKIQYYSQIQQDKYLNERIFKNKRNGVFVDIGAHDGETHSNTCFFERELGWTGICFEPLPAVFPKLQANRSCICLNVCVAPNDVEFIDFIEVTGAPEMLSGIAATYDPRHLRRLLHEIHHDGGAYTIKSIPAVCLNDVLQQYNITHIDYLSIDTEGSELEILKSIDFDRFKIHIITVENNYKSPKIRQFMTSKKFTFLTCLRDQDEIYENTSY